MRPPPAILLCILSLPRHAPARRRFSGAAWPREPSGLGAWRGRGPPPALAQALSYHRNPPPRPHYPAFTRGYSRPERAGLARQVGGSQAQQQGAGAARQTAGCTTPAGLLPGGSTWPLTGCGRGVCAITLDGSWVAEEERCDGLVQNPQYQVGDEK